MTERVVPAEFLIKPTQVMQHDTPNPDVFYPNNQGGTGWSPMPPELDERVGMDPIAKYGGDPAANAAQAGADAVAELIRGSATEQITPTKVTEYEGGSTVVYHEPTRDDQVSNVYGQEIGSDPQTVNAALLIGDKGVPRASTVSAYKARELIDRQTAGMNEGTKAAFMQMLHQKGSESIESVSAGLNEAVGTAFIKSTDSGVPLHPELARRTPVHAEFQSLMRYHGERQRKSAAKPMATYHPSQSNYRSRNGTFGALPERAYSALLTDGSSARERISLMRRAFNEPADTGGRAPSIDLSASAQMSERLRAGRGLPTSPNGAAADEIINGDTPPTPGNGTEDTTSWVDDQGLAHYGLPPEEQAAADEAKSKKIKIALAAAAGIGLILLLRG